MRIIKFTVYFILATSFVFFISELLRRKVGSFAGSYPFVETWKIKAPIEKVKETIVDLKSNHPDLFVEEDSLSFEKDHTGYWIKVSFYDKETNEVAQTLIRETDNGLTNLALVSLIDKKTGDVRLINRDFGFLDNWRQCNKFHDLIVEKIKNTVN